MRMLRVSRATAARVSAPLVIRSGSMPASRKRCLFVPNRLAIGNLVPRWGQVTPVLKVTLPLPSILLMVSFSEWPGR